MFTAYFLILQTSFHRIFCAFALTSHKQAVRLYCKFVVVSMNFRLWLLLNVIKRLGWKYTKYLKTGRIEHVAVNRTLGSKVRAPDGLDGLLVRPLPVQQGRIHVKHPLIWGGRFLWVIQASAAIQVTTVDLHSVHSSVRVWAGTGGLYIQEQ